MHAKAMSDWRIWGAAAAVAVLALTAATWTIFGETDASQPLEAPQLEQSN